LQKTTHEELERFVQRVAHDDVHHLVLAAEAQNLLNMTPTPFDPLMVLNCIDKILCFLSGKKIDKIVDLHTTIDKRCDMLNGHHEYTGKQERYDKEFETEFFRVRFFKKGTVHLTFKDVELLGVFNRAAAEGKHWVGAGY